MKRLSKSLVTLSAAALLVTTNAAAQRKPAQVQNQGDRARGLFVNKKSDAMSVTILKVEGGSEMPVAPAHAFKAGDKIRVRFQSNFDGLIYFVNIQPSGKRRVVFPHGNAVNNAVTAGTAYTIPPDGGTLDFDEEKGTEILQVIMTKDRIAALDAAIRESNGFLADAASGTGSQLKGGITGKTVALAVPREDRAKVRSRDIILAPGKTRDDQGSVVAIPDNKGTGGRLKPGEIAPFEIRLKHN